MAVVRPLTRVLDELLWILRREGLSISTAQAIEAGRVALLVGFANRETFREAIAAAVVVRRADRARFDRAFSAYFSGEAPRDLWERLGALGFAEAELSALREAFAEFAAVDASGDGQPFGHAFFERGSELEQLLRTSGALRAGASLSSELQLGFATHRALSNAGMPRARARLSVLRARLRDALGERGDALTDALAAELDRAESDVREHFARTLARRDEERKSGGETKEATSFAALGAEDAEEVRRAIRAFADRLRGGARVRRRRHERHGVIDPHRTLRGALRTGGVPLRLFRRNKRRDRPRIVLLCDVSDSVRAASSFMLELVYAAHDLFDRTRSFVFVSDIRETSEVFERLPAVDALREVQSSALSSANANSNYGRALRAFVRREIGRLDRRTTLVVLGDGRTNFQDDGAEVLRELRDRVKALYWFCPEARSTWGVGDSAMLRYERYCSKVLEVRTARDLEEAARLLVRRTS